MSTDSENLSSLFSKRIEEERKRLGLNQYQAADFCGVSREMWSKYERGLSIPNSKVLFAFAAIDADVNYIMTGKKAHLISEDNPGYTLREDQKKLLDNYEHCDQEGKKTIRNCALYAAHAAETEKPPKTKAS